MTIRPAVQPKEWERWENQGEIRLIRGGIRKGGLGDTAIFHRGTCDIIREDAPAVIAALNASLPDHDDRKFSREDVAALRAIAQAVLNRSDAPELEVPAYAVQRVADLLESYLSPAEPG